MDPHKLYMVGKKRLSGLKCILICENWLRIEALGFTMIKIGLFLQNALVEYIGVYSDTNKPDVAQHLVHFFGHRIIDLSNEMDMDLLDHPPWGGP